VSAKEGDEGNEDMSEIKQKLKLLDEEIQKLNK